MMAEEMVFGTYERHLPWNGIGTSVEGQSTVAQALVVAGLDWRVSLEALYYEFTVYEGDIRYLPVSGCCCTVRDDLPRDDPTRILGCVSPKFTPIQNVDAFEIFDILAEDAGLEFVKIGVLKEGKIVWMVVKLPIERELGEDTYQSYMVIRNAHNGSGALEVLFTPINVMGQNVMGLASRKATRRIRIRHTKNAAERVTEAKVILVHAEEYFEENLEILEDLQTMEIDSDFVVQYLLSLYPDPKSGRSYKQAANARAATHGIYDGLRATAPGASCYTLWNAITEYLDHAQGIHVKTRDPFEVRMNSLLWGSRAQKRWDAAHLLLQQSGLEKTELEKSSS